MSRAPSPAPRAALGRRAFLQVSAVAGGMVVGVCRAPEALAADTEVNAWVNIAADGTITVRVAEAEMGQGVATSLPMIVAEELDADWAQVRFELAPPEGRYGSQGTGGSSSVRRGRAAMQQAGAVARALLVAAAAARWRVEPGACRTERGEVWHPDGAQRLGYGALAAEAARLPVPEGVATKDPKDYRIVGHDVPRLDVPSKTDGSARFGIDVVVPGARVARVLRCPVFGGKLSKLDDAAARTVPGVRHVFAIDSGVAVVADGYWEAENGLRALKVTWDEGPAATLHSADMRAGMRAALDRPGLVARRVGDVADALDGAHQVHEAEYEVPLLAHAPMEPLGFTAHHDGARLRLWGGTQQLTSAHGLCARVAGLPLDRVELTPTLMGGAFGRRLKSDYIEEVVQIAKVIREPVQLVWSRADELQHGFYRPCAISRFTAGLSADGTVVAWRNHISSPPLMGGGGVDPTAVEGAANIPYAIAAVEVTYAPYATPVPVSFWRSVGSSQNGFFTEAFVDELAHVAGADRLAFRLRMLGTAPRLRGVLERAAKEAGWPRASVAGRHLGLAVAESFGSYVAHVAEVSVTAGRVRVHRVVCAADCGQIVHPDGVRAQLEGGAIFGLSAALESEITIARGRVVQSNFHDYKVLRMDEAPEIETHLIASNAPPGGAGEPGVPPAAPAVANAVRAATGRFVRALPIRLGST